MKQINAAAALLAVIAVQLVNAPREPIRGDDRGSSVVETIILVAGFATLAFTIYLAVSGKVHSWISKIPG
ncbi:hypothetical protein Acsp04_61120 [Actinomadura sp. NBRC 104425]|uniref:hypothetical protein n=1 Tax=Actinomadura sp. NBRC 104425 TaxID=3032204 RepID=UPI0024A3E0EC|nr:hypothetical protein [Actinomadura sp. NBRC 104425]GLZ15877.1 hypothetical protein Acsp04_61120 [Actinomadura sp. NBRC 104425]